MHPNSPNPISRRRVLSLAVGAVAGTALSGVLPGGAAAASTGSPGFRDPALPTRQRVEDLLGRLNLDEKIALLHQYQPAIPRLGVAAFKTGTEALHGLAWSTDRNADGAVVTATATVFPQAIGLASTWDPDLVERVGEAVGTEARGYHADNPDVWGLQLWAPTVNLLRDPRWGRNEEGYSEDPHLTGVISTAYGRGIQGEDPERLRAAPVLKHYLANNNEGHRHTTSSTLPPRVKREYYERAFEPALSADAVTGAMSAYNLINGRPMTVHRDFDELLRGWAQRPLCNVTDAGGPNNLTGDQNYYATQPEADAAILKAGLDSFTVDDTDSETTITAIRTALDDELLAESDVDEAVRHILSIRIRLGEFDPHGGPYGRIGREVVDSPAHRALARQAATRATVLLKNEHDTLPLSPARTNRIAVIGQLADTLYTDWYSGALPYEVTPLRGIRAALGPNTAVTSSEGVDRIALTAPDGRHVTATDDEQPLRLTSGADSATRFDVFGWGEEIVTLRAASNGKYLSYEQGGRTLVNDAEQPNGWNVRQRFKLRAHGGGHVLEYAGYDAGESWFGDRKYVTVDDNGRLTVTADSPEAATTFAREVVRDGRNEAVAAAGEADVAVVVAGSMPLINARETDDREDMNLAPEQRKVLELVHRANPNTVLVLENSYPTTINWAQHNLPAILWTTHAGAETGNALADVLLGRANPAGRLTQTWPRSVEDLPDILDYDVIKSERTYQYSTATPLYPFGHGLSYTTFDYGAPRLSEPVIGVDGETRVSVTVRNTGRRAGDEVVQLYAHQRQSRNPQPRKRLLAFRRVRLEPGGSRTVDFTLRGADLAHWDVTRQRWVVEAATHDLLLGSSSTDIRLRRALRVRGETIPPRDLHRETTAANFDDYAGITLTDRSKQHGTAVTASDGEGWVLFRDVDLGPGTGGITALVANASAGSAHLSVRLDEPAGRELGTITAPATGGEYAYRTVRSRLTRARGRHDVYLVLDGPTRITAFHFER
ncbi:glycoside hydrolase family 3 C-terminal domain-containing protein [Actinopolyspora halophila]|uniref:glycoside hydrolase family 3 C-terminal domain-containing protein n=1 Tax=Actinopolyspora halophila TaxID=1850 RepID=UPI0003823E17|nr:glycoside hydrolase family 3 C-terminal domain-containing protein [Actinopolyspora halophila]